MIAFLVTMLISLALNALAGTGLGLQNWTNQNWIVLAMIAAIVLGLVVKDRWAQVVAPLAMVAMIVAFPLIYYPTVS